MNDRSLALPFPFLATLVVMLLLPRALSAGGLIFAHVAIGGGYTTTFMLTNTGSAPLSGTLFLLDQRGAPLDVTLESTVDVVGSSFNVKLDSGASRVLTVSRRGAEDVKTGWARLETTGGTADGVATFRMSRDGRLRTVAGVIAASAADFAAIPVDNNAAAERFTGFAIANPQNVDVNLRITISAADGSVVEVLSPPELNPLPAGGQVARFLHQYRPAFGSFRGSMTVSSISGEKVVVVALNQIEDQFTAVPVIPLQPAWRLVWNDEFDLPDSSPVDGSRWTFDLGWGSNGWGNQELETYTARVENSYISGGKLAIKAIQETFTGPDGRTKGFTSARIKTSGKFSTRYGRVEARLKVPSGQGLWPAFWMLGDDLGTVGWPTCGEIDIMENIGREPSIVHGTLHGPGYSGGNGLQASYALPGGERFADEFHTIAIEWEENEIRWYVDGVRRSAWTTSDPPSGTRWVFDHPFFIILNLAVGGVWPGNPDATTVFPQVFEIDYVRVYQRP